MYLELFTHLSDTYLALEKTRLHFIEAAKQDSSSPFFIPPHPDNPSPNRNDAIESTAILWNSDTNENRIKSGLLCVSNNTLQATEHFNTAKIAFKDAILRIRKAEKDTKTRFDHLVERIYERETERPEEIKLALKRLKISRLDLERCYSHIRILPPQLNSISWSWKRSNIDAHRMTRDKAIELAENLSNLETRRVVISILSNISPKEELVQMRQTPNQLIANLVWKEIGQVKRKAVGISGVVLCQEKALPRYVWREDPGPIDDDNRSRLKRMDTTIEEEAFIHILRLHRYKEGTQ